MKRFGKVFKEHKRELIFLTIVSVSIVLLEVCVFNRGALLIRALNLKERRYSIHDGNLYQFDLENGKLVARGNDPGITFDRLSVPVAAVRVDCTNSIPGAFGQIFYRRSGESFSESRSVRYNAALPEKTFFLDPALGIPGIEMISSLRFDLTDTPEDSISCTDLVINPRIPLDLNPVRFAIYAAVFLLAVSLVSRNGRPLSYLRSRKTSLTVAFFALSLFLGIKLWPFAVLQHLVFVIGLCILLVSASTICVLWYLISGVDSPSSDEKSFLDRNRHEIALAAMIVITALPLLTQSYFYYDDWWNIGTGALLNRQAVIGFGRPIQILFHAVFDRIGIRNAYAFKWVFLPALILYAIVLYRWLRSKTKNAVLSLFLAGILSVFGPAMDLLGYTATSAVCYSILFSALSIVCFDRAWEGYERGEKAHFFANSVLAFLLLLTALLTYQIGTQIAFLFLAVEIYFGASRTHFLAREITFLLFFAVSNGLYLILVRVLNRIYLVTITTNRSEIIHTIGEVVGKLHFYGLVFAQSIMQIATAFAGGNLVRERYHGYIITFSDQATGKFVVYFIVAMILVTFVSYWLRTRNVLGFVSLLAFVPLSYYVFLVLSENGYLTYYAFAHLSLLTFYFLMGVIGSVQFAARRIARAFPDRKLAAARDFGPAFILAPVLVLCALISNYYVRDFYVDYNRTLYQFVKYSLETAIGSGNIKRIHVFGTISPINADVYSRFVTETALKDLGRDVGNYAITFSRSRHFLARVQAADYLSIRGSLSAADQQQLDKMYTFVPTYRTYELKTLPSPAEEEQLQRIFMAAGAIPQANSSDTLIIDLSWTDQAYLNSSR